MPLGSVVVSDTLAAIDIGTNSVHMVVARMRQSGFEILTKHKEMVRLGSGEGDMKVLRDDAMDRGVAALARCRSIADGQKAAVHAVATSAVREASNAQAFLDRVRSEAGVEINVISGTEEARLIQLGVLQAIPVYDKEIVLVDVGGGSTEILLGKGTEVDYSRSLKLGSLRMTRQFFRDGEVRPGSVEACRRLISSRLASVAHEIDGLVHEIAIASSGTAENLALMTELRRTGESPNSLNGLKLKTKDLTRLIEELAAAATTEERSRLRGVEKDRADIILGGALVLEGTALAMGIPEFVISEYALREGALLDADTRRHKGDLHRLTDIRRRSVIHLMDICDDDTEHSEQVARLAVALDEQLAETLGLSPDDQELLEAAALLANVGLFVSHTAHHKHGYYVIRHTEHLSGFTDRETEIIALVARYHRKAPPSLKHAEFAALSQIDQARVSAMAALLRIAIGLDRNHDSSVESIEVRNSKKKLEILVKGRDGADLAVETYAAELRAGMLAEIVGKPVEVRPADSTPAT
jgi:exopolyphosphatase/guanosine-5'-triphosphate,3'-diphosphate pyrophosphatase